MLNTIKYLENHGFDASYVDVDKYGVVKVDELIKSIRKDTILISVMYANNEIGTIEPIEEIAKIAKRKKIAFNTDACQAAGSLDINVNELGVSLMSINGSKIYAPKGVGILYKRKEIEIEPIIHGGGHESGLRSGTENVASIIGIAKALELAHEEKESENKLLISLRDYLINRVLEDIPKSFLNGPITNRLPNNANLSFLDIEGESILLLLNEEGICVSTGSACSSHNLQISHVLDAIGLNHDAAHGSIRFTLGRSTSK